MVGVAFTIWKVADLVPVKAPMPVMVTVAGPTRCCCRRRRVVRTLDQRAAEGTTGSGVIADRCRPDR